MSHEEIVRAWKDPDSRGAVEIAAHPAGEITLPDPVPQGGMFMAAMMAAAMMMEGSEPIGTAGCCYCDCTCGITQGCNRNLCPDPVS
jgi:mersacidin/lichenicidin family type 2 lantibiotic